MLYVPLWVIYVCTVSIYTQHAPWWGLVWPLNVCLHAKANRGCDFEGHMLYMDFRGLLACKCDVCKYKIQYSGLELHAHVGRIKFLHTVCTCVWHLHILHWTSGMQQHEAIKFLFGPSDVTCCLITGKSLSGCVACISYKRPFIVFVPVFCSVICLIHENVVGHVFLFPSLPCMMVKVSLCTVLLAQTGSCCTGHTFL